MAALLRNQWQLSYGTGGRPGVEYALMNDLTRNHVVLMTLQEACMMERAPDGIQTSAALDARARFHGPVGDRTTY